MIIEVGLCQNTVKFWQIMGIIITIAKIIVPLVIIISGIIPVYNILLNGNPEEAKKGIKALIKKMIAGVLIFYIPSLINTTIKIFVNNNLVSKDTAICSSCLNSPTKNNCLNYIQNFNKLEKKEIEEFEQQETISGSIETSDLENSQRNNSSSISNNNPNSNYNTPSNSTFNLEHAIKVHDNIHRSANGILKWQGKTINHKGGTIGAYTEVINIFNEKDYRIYEIYNTLVKAHPELKTSHNEPYQYNDMNSLYNFSVSYAPSNIDEVNKALQAGKLVQLQVHSNKWRNEKGNLVSWPGYHTGLIFYFDGTYYHMKAAGKIDQSNAIYTDKQLIEWIGGTSKKLIIYTKN